MHLGGCREGCALGGVALEEAIALLRLFATAELDAADLAAHYRRGALPSLADAKWFRNALDKVGSASGDVGKRLEYFLATGNLVSESGLDLQQTSGFTIVAERLNYWRYVSHFRSIHRGAFFAQLRTTTVRKLLPDRCSLLLNLHLGVQVLAPVIDQLVHASGELVDGAGVLLFQI